MSRKVTLWVLTLIIDDAPLDKKHFDLEAVSWVDVGRDEVVERAINGILRHHDGGIDEPTRTKIYNLLNRGKLDRAWHLVMEGVRSQTRANFDIRTQKLDAQELLSAVYANALTPPEAGDDDE